MLLLKSRSWLVLTESGKLKRYDPRLLVAVGCFPPEFSPRRAAIKGDTNRNFIILEAEQTTNPVFTNRMSSQRSLPSSLRRTVGPLLDTALVTKWINTCKEHEHSQAIANPAVNKLFEHERGFRLIDVVDECLVEYRTPREYVALSYVWGACNSWNLKCDKGNIGR